MGPEVLVNYKMVKPYKCNGNFNCKGMERTLLLRDVMKKTLLTLFEGNV